MLSFKKSVLQFWVWCSLLVSLSKNFIFLEETFKVFNLINFLLNFFVELSSLLNELLFELEFKGNCNLGTEITTYKNTKKINKNNIISIEKQSIN